jgi:dipeptidyl-peptidase-4
MTRTNRLLLAFAALCAGVAVPSLAAPQASNRGPERAPAPVPNALTVERVSIEPDADERAKSLHWSPDGARVAWMQLLRPPAKARDQLPQQEIWIFASDTSEQLPAVQKREPTLLVSAEKITAALRGSDTPRHHRLDDDDNSNPYLLQDFAWSADHASLLLIGAQSLAWFDLGTGRARPLISGAEVLSDVAISPDGQTVSFVRNHSLMLVDTKEGAKARILLSSAHEDLFEGELDWPYRNEFHLPRGYQWSPDSKEIAYLEIDDRAVAKYSIRTSSGEAREIVYPKPGGEIPLVRVFVKRVEGGESAPLEMQFGEAKGGQAKGSYLPRFTWLPDSRHLAVERLDRRQQNLELILADALTGKTQTLITEKDQYWINVSDDLRFLADGKRFLWSSQRAGFRHLYLYSLEGKQLAQLTHGDWEVTNLDAVDEAKGLVYFTATEKSPLERHLYSIHLDGSGMTRITVQPGNHEIHIAPRGDWFADFYSSQTAPPRLDILSLTPQASPISTKAASEAGLPSKSTPPLQPVEFLNLKMHLGAEAHAFLIKPPGFDPAKKYPVIVYLAGGPGEQLVRDTWGGATGLWMQLMAQKGYLIFALDNQGTAARGHYFEEPIHLRLGGQEMADQRDGLLYLSTLPYVDTARLGVCGWGYGGFLAIHGMLDRPVPYKAGFAGAPIVDWHFYDAIFAERYLDDPVAHADGWDASMALENQSPTFFKGSVMVAQGTGDEFVHVENALTLQDRLLDAGKSADFLLFPDRGHVIEDLPSRLVLYTRMAEFFVKNL